jgi:DNA-binding MarR family transcriptional regulator
MADTVSKRHQSESSLLWAFLPDVVDHRPDVHGTSMWVGPANTQAQHQLLLAVRGHPDPRGPTVGDVAGYLFLRHHSTVGLIDRAQTAGLLERQTDQDDSRAVRLRLTELGEQRLQTLTAAHLEELARLESELHALWEGLDTSVHDAAGVRRPH